MQIKAHNMYHAHSCNERFFLFFFAVTQSTKSAQNEQHVLILWRFSYIHVLVEIVPKKNHYSGCMSDIIIKRCRWHELATVSLYSGYFQQLLAV